MGVVTVPLAEAGRELAKLALAVWDCHRQDRPTVEQVVAMAQEAEEEAVAVLTKLAQ